MNFRSSLVFLYIFVSFLSNNMVAQTKSKQEIINLENKNISYSLVFNDNLLTKDSLFYKFPTKHNSIISDANFGFQIVWTGWHAPNKKNNAENPVFLDKKYFVLQNHSSKVLNNGTKQIELNFNSKRNSFAVKITLQLPKNSFYLRKKVEIRDTVFAKHFLQKISPIDFEIDKKYVDEIVKNGGFGQPVAFLSGKNGVFYGLEYPAANQNIDSKGDNYTVECSQEIGKIIDSNGVESNFAVIGISPDTRIKWWFYQYMNDIRFPVDKPYTLYNSWYDLRSPAFKNIPQQNIMNEKNIMRIADLIKANFVDKYGIHLDAFVLDDGWDIYASDWKMRKATFPHGMKPISDKLKKLNTGLGIWFGPTGGYSFRKKRIEWMYDHGYEVIGDPHKGGHNSMLCLAGKNYSKLFKKRTTDFVKNEGVSFFKWDGIQFSCSDASHGHPIDIYSRRAVMQSVIDKCDAVRKINPDVYLNITSGTWLSPWWLKYANQIWMQGQDYGYAGVPSISKRDAAMTYRDLVLHEDFKLNNFWFPISNLMTHGIIKGNLQNLGGKTEPLDKFTNNAMLYFTRGVSMYELYISPDILTDDEWRVLSQSLHWAKDRFDILKNSFFIGGDPAKKEAYGYAHFSGDKGIVAVRNPFIKKQSMRVRLATEQGLNTDAKELVVEQVYPYHYIYPETFSANYSFNVDLDGFETAVYEIYPKESAEWPLVAGTKFWHKKINKKKMEYDIECPECAVILNKDYIKKDVFEEEMKLEFVDLPVGEEEQVLVEGNKKLYNDYISTEGNKLHYDYHFLSDHSKKVMLALLYQNQEDKKIPEIILTIDGKNISGEEFKGENKWIWKTYDISKFKNKKGVFTIGDGDKITGNIELYIVAETKEGTEKFVLNLKKPAKDRIMPPEIHEPGYITKIHHLGNYRSK